MILLRELVWTSQAAREAVQELLKGGNAFGIARRPLGISRLRDGVELLAGRAGEGTLLLWQASSEVTTLPKDEQRILEDRNIPFAAGIAVGIGPQLGKATGVARIGAGAPGLLDGIRLVGPGMPALDFTGRRSGETRPGWLMQNGLYSRLVGTLGMLAFSQIQRSKIAVIGAGGNGSLMAMSLARLMGGGGNLVLIDPDVLKEYNLPAWAAAGSAKGPCLIGRPKAEALADIIRAQPDAPTVEAVVGSARDWLALAALKRCDLFVCCVDNAAARYAVSFLAALYLRPLLDVGTGVFLGTGQATHTQKIRQEFAQGERNNSPIRFGRLPSSLLATGGRAMGADVRLSIPDSHGAYGDCLLCLGGVGGVPSRIRGEQSASKREHDPTEIAPPFFEARAGSFHLLNSDAVNQGARMLIAFLQGDITESEHWQMDESLATPPTWRRMTHTPQANCPVCAAKGRGDAGLQEIDRMLSEANPV